MFIRRCFFLAIVFILMILCVKFIWTSEITNDTSDSYGILHTIHYKNGALPIVKGRNARVEGYIGPQTVDALSIWLAQPGPLKLTLTSTGGMTQAGERLYELIKQRGNVFIWVDSYCYSVCALVWLAGSGALENGARLGFHGGWATDPMAEVAILRYNRLLTQAILNKNISIFLLVLKRGALNYDKDNFLLVSQENGFWVLEDTKRQITEFFDLQGKKKFLTDFEGTQNKIRSIF